MGLDVRYGAEGLIELVCRVLDDSMLFWVLISTFSLIREAADIFACCALCCIEHIRIVPRMKGVS